MTTASSDQRDALEEKVLELGHRLQDLMQGRVPSVFDRRHWEGKILDWAMDDPDFKTDLFRFVDVLPALRSAREVAGHVREYLAKPGRQLPGLPSSVVRAASSAAAAGVLARVVRRNVEGMANRFILGRNAAEALPKLEELHRDGLAFTVDLLGEATLSEADAAAYQARYLDLIDHLPEQVSGWPADERIDADHLGPIPRANVSLKVSAMDPYLDPADPAGGVARLTQRLLPLLSRARDLGVSGHLDLEHWDIHGITFDLFEELAGHPDLRDWPHLGMTVQSYLKVCRQDLERLLSIARSRGAPVGLRLVKGAYWDTETLRARQHGTSCPVFSEKAASDAAFEELTATILENAEWFHPAFASHNLRSLANAAVRVEASGLPQGTIEIQTLNGMAEPEREAFLSLGYRVRVYAPVGELLPGMAYLVRRLLENTSNEGFLRLTHRESVDRDALFAQPTPSAEEQELAPTLVRGDLTTPFASCPSTDFTDESARRSFADAVAALGPGLPVEVPVVVAGKARFSGRTLEHPCPSETGRIASIVALATPEEAAAAVAAAQEAWPAWRSRPVAERAALLEQLGDRLEADRNVLAALEVFEVGKPWREADADVAEAVDFCRYYARQARVELSPRTLGEVPGEMNQVWYEGRGPAAIIAPWNFPLAILTGMSTAALVAGNPVILKPAEQSSAVGRALHERMLDVGFPPAAVHFLPGIGEEIGDRLVKDPRIAIIAFTGSKAVGLSLLEEAGKTQPGQPQVKRVVCEMGGKNAVIIDDDADLDAAVAGVMQSAFGFAGQKCSACSRVITVGEAHDPFVERLVEACRSLPLGPAFEPSCRLGPVVDQDAYQRLRHVLEEPGQGAIPLFVGAARSGGLYVPPAVYSVSDPQHRLLQEEFFGPVLAVFRAADFEEALAVATSTEYALTGGVYSRSPSHLELARAAFRVGNLYLNRPCTGAMVGRQPFGGFGMSGTGTQAGGPGYLLHFADPRCASENTVRRGFAPEIQV